MLHIKILGAGCTNCERLHDLAHTAVASLGIDAQIDKIYDHDPHHGAGQKRGLVLPSIERESRPRRWRSTGVGRSSRACLQPFIRLYFGRGPTWT